MGGGMSTRSLLLALATACVAPVARRRPRTVARPRAATRARSGAKVAFPKPEVAEAIVQALWIRRENALERQAEPACNWHVRDSVGEGP